MATDIAVVEPQLDNVIAPLSERAVALSLEVGALTIIDDETDLRMAELEAQAASIRKQLDDERSYYTTPYEKVKKLIIATFKPAQELIKETERAAKGKRGAYFMAKREAARKEQERLRKLAEKKQERQIAKAEARGEEPPAPIIPMPVVAAPAKTVRTASGTSTIRLNWTWEFESDERTMVEACAKAGLLEALSVNRVAVNKLVAAGLRQIPGARVFEAPVGAVR